MNTLVHDKSNERKESVARLTHEGDGRGLVLHVDVRAELPSESTRGQNVGHFFHGPDLVFDLRIPYCYPCYFAVNFSNCDYEQHETFCVLY